MFHSLEPMGSFGRFPSSLESTWRRKLASRSPLVFLNCFLRLCRKDLNNVHIGSHGEDGVPTGCLFFVSKTRLYDA